MWIPSFASLLSPHLLLSHHSVWSGGGITISHHLVVAPVLTLQAVAHGSGWVTAVVVAAGVLWLLCHCNIVKS